MRSASRSLEVAERRSSTPTPWLYRLTDLELHRENKIDGKSSFDMTRYLIADVYAMDVGGSGDSTCGIGGVSGGFVLRVNSSLGVVSDGPQMTADAPPAPRSP